ncbi:esterase-like activity of phytase family protein [Kocuria marina]|uniref:esterase-like activity of phytase family protein n=1 Tax=Kocuria marina TaxID=223184 RepID=UPI0022DF3FF0|nr:esterase-like activity of phytase family protein [Kocuria marina]
MHRSLVPAAAITVGFGLLTAGPAAAAAPSVSTGATVQVPMGRHDHSPAPGAHPLEGKADAPGDRAHTHRAGHGAHHDRHRHHGKKHRPGRGHHKGHAFEVSYVDSMVLPDELRNVDGVPFGGIFGLDYRPRDGSYLALSDDRSQKAPARFYTLDLPFDDDGFDAPGYSVTDTTVLQRADGSPYPENSLDPESIRWDRTSHTALWTDEGDVTRGLAPAIREMTPTGAFVRAFEVPRQYLPAFDRSGNQIQGVRNNLALENLTLGPCGTTFSVMNEAALVQDGPVASPETGSPLRLSQLDRRTGRNLAQYVYETEPMSVPRGSTGGDRGASEMLQLSETEYLVIERQYFEGENQIQVYRASTRGATDVSRSAALTGTEVPMKKELVIDLAVSGMSPGNVEAVSFGPQFADGDMSLVLAADDNFNLATQDTVFHLLRVNTHK